jgi:hypothetical protein
VITRISRPVAPLLGVALAIAVSLSTAVAQGQSGVRFSEAQLFLELNDTDGDLGLHASIDGEPWTALEIEAPTDRPLLSIVSRGRLRAQGLTQLAFESAEPPFDELDPTEFFRRFPEGRYQITARGQDGAEIEATAVLSHVLAAPPANLLVSGVPAAESCDSAPLPSVASPVTIEWDPVTQHHPDIGRRGSIRVKKYQLFVESEGIQFALDLPPSITAVEVPAAVTAAEGEFKFEIIVQTTAGNNTAVESCFRID